MVRTLLKHAAALAPDKWKVMAGVASVNLLLAVVALLKDVMFAGYFGTTAMADAVNTAFLLPDTIGNNLIGYVLGIAAVPHLSRIWASGQSQEFMQAAVRLTLHCSIGLALLGGILYVFEQPILGLFGQPEIDGMTRQLEQMFRLLLLCLVLFPLTAIGAAALQSKGSFYVPAFTPVLFNSMLLLGLIVAWSVSANPASGGWIFSSSILIGSGFATFYVWHRLKKEVRVRGSLPDVAKSGNPGKLFSMETLLPIYRDFGPLFLVIMVTQCLYTVERILASGFETGTLAGLNYAYRIAQFPNWVFIAALTSVILPAISRNAGRPSAVQEVYRALRATGMIMVPVAIILYLARKPIITVMLGRGAFGPESVEITSALLAGYSLSVVGQALSMVCLRYFIANGRMRNVVWIYSATILLSIVFDIFALERFGPASLGYGAMLGWSANAALMIGLWMKDSHSRKAIA